MKPHPFASYPAAWAICPTRFFLAFAQGGLWGPLLPLLRETFNVSYGELGLLTSMFGLSCVGMDIFATRVLCRQPLLHVLLQGISLTGLGLLCCIFAPGFYWLVGSRVLLGLGVSMARFACLTVMVTATPRTAQGRAHNLLEFAAIAGSVISPLLSGMMAAMLHWRLAFGIAMIFMFGAFAWVLYTRQALAQAIAVAGTEPNANSHPAAQPMPVVADPPLVRCEARAMRIAYLTTFVMSFIWAGFLSTALPLFGGDVVGLPASTLGMVIAVGLLADLALLMPMGWVSDRLEGRTVLAPALLLMAMALTWLPQAFSLAGLLLVSLCLHGSFSAWGMPSAALAIFAPGGQLARAMALYRLLVDGAAVIAPWLIGTLIERYGYGLPARYTAIIAVGTALLVAWGLRPVRRSMAPRPA